MHQRFWIDFSLKGERKAEGYFQTTTVSSVTNHSQWSVASPYGKHCIHIQDGGTERKDLLKMHTWKRCCEILCRINRFGTIHFSPAWKHKTKSLLKRIEYILRQCQDRAEFATVQNLQLYRICSCTGFATVQLPYEAWCFDSKLTMHWRDPSNIKSEIFLCTPPSGWWDQCSSCLQKDECENSIASSREVMIQDKMILLGTML